MTPAVPPYGSGEGPWLGVGEWFFGQAIKKEIKLRKYVVS